MTDSIPNNEGRAGSADSMAGVEPRKLDLAGLYFVLAIVLLLVVPAVSQAITGPGAQPDQAAEFICGTPFLSVISIVLLMGIFPFRWAFLKCWRWNNLGMRASKLFGAVEALYDVENDDVTP
ncbi:MAG: hypothetical protein ACKVJX_01965 [Verrucomicrobiia bacterium]|jgi:hypothetical protein